MESSVEPLELTLVCSHGSSDDISRENGGPGRTAGRILDSAGNKLDVIISRSAERLGYGPRVTAQRIRARSRLLHVALSPPGHVCEVGFDAEVEETPSKIREQRRKVEKDIRRLLKYVKSNVPLTRRQAVNHILDLSTFCDETLDLLKSNDATKIISDMMRVYSDFRFGENDDLLLSSSRKALISLGDAEINKLLKRWVCLATALNCSDSRRNSRRIKRLLFLLWEEISKYLRYPDIAFLIVRTLRKSNNVFSLFFKLCASIFTSMSSHTSDFEWDEFEPVFDTGSYSLTLANHTCLPSVYIWFIKCASQSPQIRNSRSFKELIPDFHSGHRSDAVIASTRSRAIIEGLANKEQMGNAINATQLHDVLKYAGHSVEDYNNPVGRTVTKFISGNWYFAQEPPGPEEYDIYKEIVSYLDGPDSSSQSYAWKYVNYFLAVDIYRCEMMLSALSSSSFGSSPYFQSFVEAKLQACLPKHDKFFAPEIYRHYCHEDKSMHLNDHNYNCYCEGTTDEDLLYSPDWILKVRVARGQAFSSAGYTEPVATFGSESTPGFIARLVFKTFDCLECDISMSSMYAVVTDGTKPEDFHIQLQCLHRTLVTVPWALDAWVLRYAPAAHAKVLGCSEDKLHTTGLFSWRLARMTGKRGNKFRVRLSKMERIAPGTEVSEEERSDQATIVSALEFDDEGHCNGCSESDGSIPLSDSFNVEDVETDFKIDAEVEANALTAELVPQSALDGRDGVRSQAIQDDRSDFGDSDLEERGTESIRIQKEMSSRPSSNELDLPWCGDPNEGKHEDIDVGLGSSSIYGKGKDKRQDSFELGMDTKFSASQNYYRESLFSGLFPLSHHFLPVPFKQSLSSATCYILVFLLGIFLARLF